MSISEALVRIFYAARPLLPYLLLAACATVAVTIVLLAMGRYFWFDTPGFRWLGIFYRMEGLLCVRMGCAWTKLILVAVYLILFQSLDAVHYLLLFVPIVIYAIDLSIPEKIPGNLLTGVMQLGGVFAANVICGYYREVSRNWILVAIYILISIFIILYSLYLFFTELNALSQGRRHVNDIDVGK